MYETVGVIYIRICVELVLNCVAFMLTCGALVLTYLESCQTSVD